MIDLSPTLDDYSALGLSNSAFNPTVDEVEEDLNSDKNDPFTIYKIIEPSSSDLVDVTIFLSFRTPYTRPERVSDQLPVTTMLSKNVPYKMLNNIRLTNRFTKFAYTHARRQYPCSQFDANKIKYRLTEPRFGYWSNPKSKCTDILVHQGNQCVKAIKNPMNDQGQHSVYLSLSFLIVTEPQTASDKKGSASKEKENENPDVKNSVKASGSDVNIWMNRLLHLASLPQDFETLAKYAQLASHIKSVLQPVPSKDVASASAKPKSSRSVPDARSLLKPRTDLRNNLKRPHHRPKDLRHDLERKIVRKNHLNDIRRNGLNKKRTH